MAQATSPSMSLPDGHQNNHHNTPHVKSNPEVPIDPSIAASSPTYPPYSPYAQQSHDMSQYQGHPPPGYPHWPQQQYAGHPHGLPNGPYSSPGTAVSAAGAVATAGPRPGQVGVFHRAPPDAVIMLTGPEPASLISGLLVRAHPRSPAAQAPASPLRRNRAHVQMRVARLREGVWHVESSERARYHAIARQQTDPGRYVLRRDIGSQNHRFG